LWGTAEETRIRQQENESPHRGDIDYGTHNTSLLLSLKRLDHILSFSQSKYGSMVDPNEFLDTGEVFGMIPNGMLLSAETDDEPREEDDDNDDPVDDEAHDDDDDDDDEEEAVRITAAEAEFNAAMGLQGSVPLLLPNSPSKDEVQLYKSLVLLSVDEGGSDVDMPKVLVGWNNALKVNSRLPVRDRKSLRVATLISLEKLREKIAVQDNQSWSAEPIAQAAKELRKVLFCLHPKTYTLN
jgi:tRNA-binding EMAP/Myf-like protein